MARIEYRDLSDPGPALAPVLDKIRQGRPFVPNVYRMLLWSPSVTERWVELANTLRFESSVSDRSRELAILVVSHLTGCAYEWHHHAEIAQRVGVSPEEIEAVRAWPDLSALPADDVALLRVVGAMTQREPLPEAELAALVERMGEETVVELLATVSYYIGLAHLLLALEVEVEVE